MGNTPSAEAASAAEAQRLVDALTPATGGRRRLARTAWTAAATILCAAQYVVAYGAVAYVIHAVLSHPDDASAATVLLLPFVIVLTWAVRAVALLVVVAAGGADPPEWDARWVGPAAAAAALERAAAAPTGALVLSQVLEVGRAPETAVPVGDRRDVLGFVCVTGRSTSTGLVDDGAGGGGGGDARPPAPAVRAAAAAAPAPAWGAPPPV